MSFGLQLDPKFWFFPGLYNYAIVYVASIFGFEDLTVKFVHGCAVGRPSLSFRETSRSREYWRVLRGKLPCGAVAVLLITMTKRKAAGEDNKQLSSWFDAVNASNDRTDEGVRRKAASNVTAATACAIRARALLF